MKKRAERVKVPNRGYLYSSGSRLSNDGRYRENRESWLFEHWTFERPRRSARRYPSIIRTKRGATVMNDTTPLSFSQKFARGLALFLPGIFLLGFNLGTGSVTAMAKAGAEYGMTLLWTIVTSCLCTFFMINLYGRYTLVTGETALEAFKKAYSPCSWHLLYCRLDARRMRQRHGGNGDCCRDLF